MLAVLHYFHSFSNEMKALDDMANEESSNENKIEMFLKQRSKTLKRLL
jgi:hypothetical protein